MQINNTLNHLLARRSEVLLPFSGAVTTASTYLKGAGGETGDGFPLPKGGKIVGLNVWDGVTHKSGTDEIVFSAGDRISLYAAYNAPVFTATVRINGVDTTLIASSLAANSTYMAHIHLIME
jgi:hypothetical protein